MRSIVLTTAAVLTSVAAHAAVVAQYDFPAAAGNTLPSASTDTSAGSSAGSLSKFSGLTGGISTVTGNPANCLFLSTLNNTTETNAFNGNKYFSFTVTPDAGTLSYLSLNFDGYRDTAAAATKYALYASTGSFTSGNHVAVGDLTTDVATFRPHSIDLSGITALQNVSAALTFRVYLWGSTDSTRNARFDNITVSAVPEPTGGLLLLGAGGLAMLRRRGLAR